MRISSTYRSSSRAVSLPLGLLCVLGLWSLGGCQLWDGQGSIFGASPVAVVGAGSQKDINGEGIVEEKRTWEYVPVFSNLATALYGKRQDSSISLENNQPSRNVISLDDTHQFFFPLSELSSQLYDGLPVIPPSTGALDDSLMEGPHSELKKRQGSGHILYLTLSVCGQPSPTTGDSDGPPPGLDLYISSPGRTDPGPGSSDPGLRQLATEEGFTYHVDDFAEDVHFAVHAPGLSGYSGQYTYEVTASIDDCFTFYNDYQSMYVMDSDHEAGMFTTTNLTNSTSQNATGIEEWMASGAPFTVFVHNQDDPQIVGMRRSYCGLENNAQIKGTSTGVETSITTAGAISARQQFYVPGLNASSSYYAILGLPSNYSQQGSGVPTGGGMVWQHAELTTNSDESCKLLFNLSFCNTVSYAAPAPANGSLSAVDLGNKYDAFAQSLYQNFSYSLAQFACDTTPDAQYSLATNCSTCDAAYQRWLCAVTIPRCSDTTGNTSASIPRNASSSRNSLIQDLIDPGPYNEIPPCGSLCFGLVQHCPAGLQFSCPYPNTWYYNQTYGYAGGNSSNPTCNDPGNVWGASHGNMNRPYLALVMTLATSVAVLLS